MCGFCYTIDTSPVKALNELVYSKLTNIKSFEEITERYSAKGLITAGAGILIEKSIKQKDPNLLAMIQGDNRAKLTELALIESNMWLGRAELRVHILPHPFGQHINDYIEKYASEWVPYTKIPFIFSELLPADIIIQVNGHGAHSSQIGRNSLLLTNNGLPSMHLGIATFNEDAARRPILHEFGHALGCIHEHQSPASSIKWNEQAVIRAYSLADWSEEKVRHNVFAKFTTSEITNSQFDPDSIMIYPIADYLTTDGYSVGWNTQLSAMDKAFMQKAYGRY